MRRPGKPNEPEEPMLFDLPLSSPGSRGEPGEDEEALPVTPKRASRETRRAGPVPVPRDVAAPEPSPRSEFAGPVRRIAGGIADLIVHAAVGVLALLGCRWLEVQPQVREWPAFAAFLLAFSFLYTVLPLAFWGHTPGMAWAAITSRNISRDGDGEPLTFDQTVRRWVGALLTLALVGLPVLLGFGGRTLTDWISGSATYPQEEEE